MTRNDARAVLLEVIQKQKDPQNCISREEVLRAAFVRSEFKHGEGALAVLTAWDDLYRAGLVGYGMNSSNTGFGWAHLTSDGLAAINERNQEPSNPAGYLGRIDDWVPQGSIARGYIEEALRAFDFRCERATAVMVGAAAEALALELRDEVVTYLDSKQRPVPADLRDWRTKKVLDALAVFFDGQLKQMPRALAEPFQAYWGSISGQLRMTRNDAGHPSSIVPATRESVHAGLLLFPMLAKMVGELRVWVRQLS